MFEQGPNNIIHPTAIIDSTVKIGGNNTIGPYCVIGPNVEIGDCNHIVSHVSIGAPAQHRETFRDTSTVVIGCDNVIREFVTIHASTTGHTRVGSGCYLMACSHVSHDTVLEDGVTLANNVLLGGKSYVMKGANLGLGAVVHQRSCIGSWSMLGMGCVITKSMGVLPGYIYVGNPSRQLKKNTVGLERAGVVDTRDEVQRWTQLRYQLGMS